MWFLLINPPLCSIYYFQGEGVSEMIVLKYFFGIFKSIWAKKKTWVISVLISNLRTGTYILKKKVLSSKPNKIKMLISVDPNSAELGQATPFLK